LKCKEENKKNIKSVKAEKFTARMESNMKLMQMEDFTVSNIKEPHDYAGSRTEQVMWILGLNVNINDLLSEPARTFAVARTAFRARATCSVRRTGTLDSTNF
jgi:hypothetical protein